MAIALTMSEAVSDADRAPKGRECDALAPLDEETFGAFYDRTARPVRAYLSRVTGDSQLADDLLQETYYRFLRADAMHESETHRRNSLFCIATNVARDVRRRRRFVHDVPIPESEVSMQFSVDERTGARVAARADLSRAMARLRPVQREMIWLAYAQGASHSEIAEILGLKPGSIKQLLFRARRTLAELLGVTRASVARGAEHD